MAGIHQKNKIRTIPRLFGMNLLIVMMHICIPLNEGNPLMVEIAAKITV
jgi:uncharacterized membrane protein